MTFAQLKAEVAQGLERVARDYMRDNVEDEAVVHVLRQAIDARDAKDIIALLVAIHETADYEDLVNLIIE